MSLAAVLIRYVLSIFLICLFLRVLISYFPISSGGVFDRVQRVVGAVTDPILVPLRRVLPPVSIGEGAAIDLSPLVVFLACFIILLLI